jgi:hypothetical protein
MSLDNLDVAKSQLKSLDFEKSQLRLKKACLDESINLYLDLHWSRLSRPPSLTVTIDNRKNVEQKLESALNERTMMLSIYPRIRASYKYEDR